MDKDTIPHSRPSLSREEIKAVSSVLRSGQLSQGPKVKEFEKRIALYVGKKEAVAVSSGSAALHLSLLALGVKTKEDEVILPSYVCPAVLNAVYQAGGNPVIVDIDPKSYNISAWASKKVITRRTRAIIVPHMFGCPADMEELIKLGIPIIEDCAQSIGATFKGRLAGSFGLVSIFSFFATKVLTSGEGGMVLSDSQELIEKIKDLRDYDERDSYLVRYNYKITDIQAALGLVQLARLEKFISRRKEIAIRYFEEFGKCRLDLPIWKEGKEHIYYRFVIKAREEASSYLEKLQKKKIICRRPIYLPLHVYLNLSGFPHTTEAWQKAISIPLYPTLTEREIEKIVATIKEIF